MSGVRQGELRAGPPRLGAASAAAPRAMAAARAVIAAVAAAAALALARLARRARPRRPRPPPAAVPAPAARIARLTHAAHAPHAPHAAPPPHLALDTQLRHAQKMELVGQLAGGMAHDFNNLLTIITASARFAHDALPDGSPVREELEAVDEAAQRAAQLTRQLLAFSRREAREPQLLDLNAVVAGVEPMLRRLLGEDIAVLTRRAPALGPVLGDQGQLEQVIVNLAVNARDAMTEGGRLILETANVELTPEDAARRRVLIPPGSYVRLTVCDTGAGMDERTCARAFEPFFTTKGPGKGTGLGLAIVYGIVKQAGGFVWITSTPGKGTRVDVDLPRVAHDDAAPRPAHAAARAAAGSETLLLVEDEADVRRVARRILSARGYTVLEAGDGRSALRLADGHAGTIDLVVTDVVMPEMSGRSLVRELGVRRPELRALFVSGYTDEEMRRRGLRHQGAAFLEKPFTADALAAAVRSALDGHAAERARAARIA